MKLPRERRRGMTRFTELLVVLLAVQGAIAGVVWGWINFGIVGAVLGLPLGAVFGILCLWVMILAIGIVAYIGFCVWAVYRRGPRGLVLLYRYGPDGVARGGPPRPPEPRNQPNGDG